MKARKGSPAGDAMETAADGKNGLPTATVSPESLPPQLLIQHGELLVRVGDRAPVPLATWLARWLARASRGQCDRRSVEGLLTGGCP